MLSCVIQAWTNTILFLSTGNPDIYKVIGQTAYWKIYSFKPLERDNDAVKESRNYYKVSMGLQGRLAAQSHNYHSRNTVFYCTCQAMTWHPEMYCKHIAYLIIHRYEPQILTINKDRT